MKFMPHKKSKYDRFFSNNMYISTANNIFNINKLLFTDLAFHRINQVKMETAVSADWTNVKFNREQVYRRCSSALLALSYAYNLSTTFQNRIMQCSAYPAFTEME